MAFQRTEGNRDFSLRGHKQNFVHTETQRRGQWHHRRLNQNYLLVLEDLLWRCGLARLTPGMGGPWSYLGVHHYPHHRLQGWVASGECNTTHQLIIGLSFTSKDLPTRARPSFSHRQSLPSRSLHKPLSLIHQKQHRRTKKKHSLTAGTTKTILQKPNHDEKAESYVPDEGTR